MAVIYFQMIIFEENSPENEKASLLFFYHFPVYSDLLFKKVRGECNQGNDI
jgi:hypothetical protein